MRFLDLRLVELRFGLRDPTHAVGVDPNEPQGWSFLGAGLCEPADEFDELSITHANTVSRSRRREAQRFVERLHQLNLDAHLCTNVCDGSILAARTRHHGRVEPPDGELVIPNELHHPFGRQTRIVPRVEQTDPADIDLGERLSLIAPDRAQRMEPLHEPPVNFGLHGDLVEGTRRH